MLKHAGSSPKILMKRGNVPIRTCIGCRCKFPQKALIRFVCSADQTLAVEELVKLPGRGTYVCHSETCIQRAFNAPKRINALLRAQLSKPAIDEFKKVLLEKEEIADEKETAAKTCRNQ